MNATVSPDMFLLHFWPAWRPEIRMWFAMASGQTATPDQLTGRVMQKLCRCIRDGSKPVTPGLCIAEVIRWLHLDCEGAEAMAARILLETETVRNR